MHHHNDRYDFIIFGATGFTGQFVVEEVGRICAEETLLNYAIAGRSEEKLKLCLENANKNTNLDFSNVEIIVCDVNDYESLLSMARKGKIIINCVGPFRFHGLKVIEACVAEGANHIDISGEPEYLEKAQLQFYEAAKEKNIHIIGSCGFDSIPADLGTLFLQNHFGGDINSVDMVVGLHDDSKGSATINVTTLECALYGYSNRGELGKIRRELFKEKLPKSSFKPEPKGNLWWSEEAKRWCVPNMASDRSVVMRTQRLNYQLQEKRPLQFNAYFGTKSKITAIGMMIFGLIFAVMAPFSFTRNLFLKFPSFFSFGAFSKQGSKREDLKDLKFCITLIGKGWNSNKGSPEEQHSEPPNITKVAQVIGPDPGYFGTAILVTQAALTLLSEREKFPKNGGVFTPGSAFLDTTLIKRLERKGIKFLLVSDN